MLCECQLRRGCSIDGLHQGTEGQVAIGSDNHCGGKVGGGREAPWTGVSYL